MDQFVNERQVRRIGSVFCSDINQCSKTLEEHFNGLRQSRAKSCTLFGRQNAMCALSVCRTGDMVIVGKLGSNQYATLLENVVTLAYRYMPGRYIATRRLA